MKGDFKNSSNLNRGEQCTRWQDQLPEIGELGESYPSRVQRPFLHADGYENLLWSVACRRQKGGNGSTPNKEYYGQWCPKYHRAETNISL